MEETAALEDGVLPPQADEVLHEGQQLRRSQSSHETSLSWQ